MTKFGLGLNHGEFNSSAALVKDGAVVSAAPEERFSRQKRTKAFPANAAAFCLDTAGISLDECQYVAQAWNPGAGWNKFNPLISAQRVQREDYFYSVPDNLFNLTERRPNDWVRMGVNGSLPDIYYIQHHRAHAANAFFLSPFEEAAILTCDWRGEIECTTLCHGRGSGIDVLQTHEFPNSLGLFYSTFTELLGYKPDSDEWKVMALSAFDVDCAALAEDLRATIRLGPEGSFELDQSIYKGALVDQPKLYTSKLLDIVGGRKGEPGEEADEWHFRVAKAMQMVAEDVAVHFLDHLYDITQAKAVALGGGFFMNSVFNGKILERTRFEEFFVSYAPADVGNSIGAALYVQHCLDNAPRANVPATSYLGPNFEDSEIEAALRRRGIAFEQSNRIEAHIAELLNSGHIVARFNGAMEFGERALGNRSILADPRDAGIKDKINSAIKYRESYRPFAPAVPAKEVSTYFDVTAEYASPFMEKVVPVREEFRDRLPAVTHVDGSARVQTVSADNNAGFCNVLREFEKLSGLPVVLNTSFNINGEPIVLSPDDALTTFFNSGLTHMAIGNFLVSKS